MGFDAKTINVRQNEGSRLIIKETWSDSLVTRKALTRSVLYPFICGIPVYKLWDFEVSQVETGEGAVI